MFSDNNTNSNLMSFQKGNTKDNGKMEKSMVKVFISMRQECKEKENGIKAKKFISNKNDNHYYDFF